jgi:E3 ubiquitin-protein ligase SIAH1
MNAATPLPQNSQYTSWPDVTGMQHLVITVLEVKMLLQYAEIYENFVLDMDDLSRALDKDLLKELECPVCMEYMVPPIKMCTNGHNICSKCRTRVQYCPTCRAEFLEIRNLALENIARRLKYPCVNRQNGCLHLFSIEHIAEHQAACVYGNIKCPFHLLKECSWRGLKSSLKEHAKTQHRGNWSEASTFSSPLLSETVLILSCFGESFMYYKRKRDDTFFCAVQLIGTSSEASKYKCQFTLRAANGIEQISNIFLVQSYSEDFETIYNSGKCLYINKGIIKDFVNGNNLNLSIKLSTV